MKFMVWKEVIYFISFYYILVEGVIYILSYCYQICIYIYYVILNLIKIKLNYMI